jgi:capping protein beta
LEDVYRYPIRRSFVSPPHYRALRQFYCLLTLLTTTRDLLRRLSPTEVSENVARITTLVPDLTEDLLSSVDQPLQVRRCKKSGRDYLLCDYNRDGDSYRSPWSNEFDPPLDDGTVPSERVRKLEVEANAAFDVYRELYYEGGVGSVYFWDLDDGFAGVVLLKKSVSPGSKSSGAWDSIHVFEATDRARTSHYKLTSTVILYLAREGESLGEMNLSGNMTRQVEADLPVENDQSHVVNIGRLVEDMELKMRNLLQEVYFGKAKDVVGDLRSKSIHLDRMLAWSLTCATGIPPLTETNRDKAAHRDIINSMAK